MKNLEELKQEARSHHVPVMLDDGMTFLLQYIQNHDNIRQILEIGTAVGLSSMKMARIRSGIEIDTIEVNLDMYHEAVKNIYDNQLDKRIHVYLGDGAQFKTDKIYDLVFVDAAKSQYRNYTEHFWNNTKVGSVFVYDNLRFHGMVDDPTLTHNRSTKQMVRKIKVFREWLLNHSSFQTTYYPEIGDGIAIAIRIK